MLRFSLPEEVAVAGVDGDRVDPRRVWTEPLVAWVRRSEISPGRSEARIAVDMSHESVGPVRKQLSSRGVGEQVRRRGMLWGESEEQLGLRQGGCIETGQDITQMLLR